MKVKFIFTLLCFSLILVFRTIAYQKSSTSYMVSDSTENLEIATEYFNKGKQAWIVSDYDLSLEFFSKALKVRSTFLDPVDPDIATTYNALGIVSWKKGQQDDALKYYYKSLEILKKIHPDNHPQIAKIYHNISIVLMERGAYEQALNFLSSALFVRDDIAKQLITKYDIATRLHMKSIIYRKMKEYIKAEKYGSAAIDTLLSDQNYSLEALADFNLSLGMIYLEQGDHVKSSFLFTNALNTYLKLYDRNHSSVSVALHNLGLATFDFEEKMSAIFNWYDPDNRQAIIETLHFNEKELKEFKQTSKK